MCAQVNFYEIKPSPRKKRKISTPCENTFMNPALDLISTEDPMWNNAMEIKVPNKKRKRSKSFDDIASFENCALDLGLNKQALCALLSKELQNVKQNLNTIPEVSIMDESQSFDKQCNTVVEEPVYVNMAEINKTSKRPICSIDTSPLDYTKDFKVGITNLSFIDKLDINSPSGSLCLDDDLNESNIMEIKTIENPKIPLTMLSSTNPFLEDMMTENLKAENKPEFIYNDDSEENIQDTHIETTNLVIPRRLFINDTDTTISTVNDVSSSNPEDHEYATIEELNYEAEYENIPPYSTINKQSKILGHDVSNLTSLEILNLCNNGSYSLNYLSGSSNDTIDSNDGKKGVDFKHHLIRAGNRLSKRMFKKLKNLKSRKQENSQLSTTLNPYEVPRKPEKSKATVNNVTCFENPALSLGNSDSESDEEEPTYETIKTAKNTIYNMNVTPLAERNTDDYSQNVSNVSSKKQVRFDATLNREKIITGNSFDSGDFNETKLDIQIDQFHDELENCLNEKKIIAMNS